jgi:hypothetical protein
MKASEFDERFDNGEDIMAFLDLSKAERPNQKHKRVNVDFPVWMIAQLDQESQRVGVTRQSLIKIWLADKLASVSEKTLEKSALAQ